MRTFMVDLRKNKLLALVLCTWLVGCSTPNYRVVKESSQISEFTYEISFTPNRAIVECEKLFEDSDIYYGFMIHILDEKNTVITAFQADRIKKLDCVNKQREVSKILRNGAQIYLGGFIYHGGSREKGKELYSFPGIGTYHSNGRGFKFRVISNNKGGCYDTYHGTTKPCPRDGFLGSRKPQK